MRLSNFRKVSFTGCFICKWAGCEGAEPDGTSTPVFVWPRYKLNIDPSHPMRQWNLRIQSSMKDGPLRPQNLGSANICLEHSSMLEKFQRDVAEAEVVEYEAYHSYLERKER